MSQVLVLFPNPTTNFINLSLGNINQVKEIQIQIVNAMGKRLYQKAGAGPDLAGNLSVSVVDLPAGTYYLVLLKDGKSESKPFIKL